MLRHVLSGMALSEKSVGVVIQGRFSSCGFSRLSSGELTSGDYWLKIGNILIEMCLDSSRKRKRNLERFLFVLCFIVGTVGVLFCFPAWCRESYVE